MNKETLRMQMLAGVITEGQYKAKLEEIESKEKDSLNEHYVAGGIVGLGAINQIPSRAKADYEDAFEHFLGERYQVKPNRERDDIKDINEEEVEEGNQNDWWVKADGELGLDFDGDSLEDLLNSDEGWQAAFAEKVLAIDSDNYEDYRDQVSAIYDETNPF
jgi:hypothetical protein